MRAAVLSAIGAALTIKDIPTPSPQRAATPAAHCRLIALYSTLFPCLWQAPAWSGGRDALLSS